jgi:hypothetical protein
MKECNTPNAPLKPKKSLIRMIAVLKDSKRKREQTAAKAST